MLFGLIVGSRAGLGAPSREKLSIELGNGCAGDDAMGIISDADAGAQLDDGTASKARYAFGTRQLSYQNPSV